MAESITMAILYGIILNVPAAMCGVIVNFLFFQKSKPSAGIVFIACLVFFMVALSLSINMFGSQIGIYGGVIAAMFSIISFNRTVDI